MSAGASAWVRVSNTVKSVVRSASKEGATPIDRLAAVGDVEEAAVKEATKNVVQNATNQGNPVAQSLQTLTTNLRTDKAKIAADPGNLSREGVARITEGYDSTEANTVKAITDMVKIERVDFSTATEAQLKVLAEAQKDLYRGIRNDIMDVTNPAWDHPTGTWNQDLVIGQGTKLFESAAEAEAYKALNRIPDARVEEAGALYVLKQKVPVKLDSPEVRAIIRTEAQEPTSLWGVFKDNVRAATARIRSPEHVQGLQQNLDRHTAIYGRNKLIDFIQQEAEPLAKLSKSKEQWDDLGRIVNLARDHRNPNYRYTRLLL
jgi:hypothetical protein